MLLLKVKVPAEDRWVLLLAGPANPAATSKPAPTAAMTIESQSFLLMLLLSCI